MDISEKLPTPMKKRKNSLLAPQRRFAYLVLIIPMAVLFTFVILPTILAGVYSFTDYNMITAPVFIGLKNFTEMFADPIFIHALRNTSIYMVVCVILQVGVGLGLAMVVTREWLKGKTFFRTTYFLPVVLSMVAVSIVLEWVFDSRVGLINLILNYVGIPAQPWLTSEKTALFTIILISVWKYSGYNVIIFTAAIQNLPKEYYEAAAVDGSNGFTEFWYITLPLIQPAILFTSITSAIGSFQAFDAVYVITNAVGGPNFSTMTLLLYLYKHAFDGMRFGYGSAVSIVMFVILMVLTMVQLRIGRANETMNA